MWVRGMRRWETVRTETQQRAHGGLGARGKGDVGNCGVGCIEVACTCRSPKYPVRSVRGSAPPTHSLNPYTATPLPGCLTPPAAAAS